MAEELPDFSGGYKNRETLLKCLINKMLMLHFSRIKLIVHAIYLVIYRLFSKFLGVLLITIGL